MIQDNLASFKTILISHFKTDNVIIDIVLGSILMFIIHKIQDMIYVDTLFQNFSLNNIYFRNKYSVNFELTTSTHTYAMNKYSMTYMSIMHYITNNTNISVKSLTNIDNTTSSFDNQISGRKGKIDGTCYALNDNNSHILLVNGIYCNITKTEDEIKSEMNSYKLIKNNIEIYSYKYDTNVLKEFVRKECYEPFVKHINENMNGKQYIFKYSGIDPITDSIDFKEKELNLTKSFDNIFFEEKDKLLQQLNFFLNNKKWYNKKGIPYKLGIILHGHPGCGKTSIIKAILNYTQRHAIFMNLNNFEKESTFQDIFYDKNINTHYIPYDKRVYIFEEIDVGTCKITGRRNNMVEHDKKDNIENKLIDAFMKKESNEENTKKNDELTLGSLLNQFDGIESNDGSIIIATTNHIDKIDPALIRPGRMDIHIELKKCSRQITLELIAHFFDISIYEIPLKESIMDYVFSPAEILQICFKYKNNIKECMEKITKY